MMRTGIITINISITFLVFQTEMMKAELHIMLLHISTIYQNCKLASGLCFRYFIRLCR